MIQKWSVVNYIFLILFFIPALCRGLSHEYQENVWTKGGLERLTRTTLLSGPPANGIEGVELAENNSVTVQLIDGSIYPNAKITVDWDYLVLLVQTGNRPPINISFDEVEFIFDTRGQDITKEVLREYASPSRTQDRSIEGWESAGDAQRDPGSISPYRYGRRSLPWKFSLTISPTYPYPFGTWYEGTKPHVGARILASLGVSREVAIEFGYQYQPLGDSSNSDDIRIRVDKFFFGPRYLGRARDASFWGYGSFGIGGYRHLIKIETVFSDPYSGTTKIDVSSSETKFGMTYAGGIVYMFSPNAGLDLGGRFDWVLGSVESTSSLSSGISNGYFAEFNAGLVLAF